MNWLKILVGISATLIAGCAAFFSVTGLGILFSGASLSVMVMAGSLEFAKLVTATYLKQSWDNLVGFNKWYLTASVIVIMLITSAGIFGYLSNAFQQQNIKIEQVQREIDVWNNRITVNNQQIINFTGQLSNLQSNQDNLITKGNINTRLLRSVDNRDKQTVILSSKISKLQDDNVKNNEEINKIKNNNISLEKEVGGFRFVAESFGIDLKSVVKFFILLIVFVFDPLAIALVIAFNQLLINERVSKHEIDAIIDDGGISEFIKKQKSEPEELKNFVDETNRIHLSNDDLKKLEEILINPPPPNDRIINGAKKHNELVESFITTDPKTWISDENNTIGLSYPNLKTPPPGIFPVEIDSVIQDEPPILTKEDLEQMEPPIDEFDGFVHEPFATEEDLKLIEEKKKNLT